MRYMNRGIMALALTALAACRDDDYGSNPTPAPPSTPVPTVLSATGTRNAKIDEFRALLGEPDNGGRAGQQPAGRRRPISFATLHSTV